MKKKMFLTSAIAMGVVAPVFAESFPSNGLMQENKTYTNAANETNMDGVYQGSVNATAQYDVIDYILSAGQYLPKDSDTQTICPAGSFCAGGTFQYDEENDQGLTSCPTIDDATFTSVAGSSAVTACYQEDSAMSTALLNPVTIAHLNTSVSGNGYVNGVKYKSATTAARRYATSATAAGDWSALDESDLAITGLACNIGYHYKPEQPNLTSLIGITEAAVDYGYKLNSGTGSNKNEDKYGITQNGEFVVDYGSEGKIYGHAQCSTRAGASGTWTGIYNVIDSNFTATLPDSSGQYCYCQLDSYTPVSGTAIALSAPWVYESADADDASDCADSCAIYCANGLRLDYSDTLAFRAAVFGTIQSGPAMCEATNYMLNAGQYLPADSETPTTCPAGSYCSGIGNVNYNENSAQGIQSCPSEYALSAEGTSSQNDCYRACTISDIDAVHSTGVSGNYYYGDNNQCEPTGCVKGWHVKSASSSSPAMCEATNYMLNAGQYLPADSETVTTCPTGSYCSGIGNVNYNENSAQGIQSCPTGYTLSADGASSANECYRTCTTSDVAHSATVTGEYYYGDNNQCEPTACENGYHNVGGETLYQLADLADFTGVDISVVQQLFPGKTTVTEDEIKATLTQQLVSMFVDDYAEELSEAGITHDQYIQGYVINYLTASQGIASCEANTITINWSNASDTDIATNNAGTATYGSDVRTPVKAETIKGKTFKGWKFSKPTTTQLP